MELSLLVMSAFQASGGGVAVPGGCGGMFGSIGFGFFSLIGIILALIPIWLTWRGVLALERIASSLEGGGGKVAAATKTSGGPPTATSSE